MPKEDARSATDFIVASFHAAPLTALNSLRRHQIRAALKELSTLGKGAPILMVGDFNYPVFKENLGQVGILLLQGSIPESKDFPGILRPIQS